MKLNLRFFHFADTPKHRNLLKHELEPLAKDMPIGEAKAIVTKLAEGDGRVEAQVHLAVPGPDIRASATDYTLEAAMKKLGRRIREIWKHRLSKRTTTLNHLRLAPSRVS